MNPFPTFSTEQRLLMSIILRTISAGQLRKLHKEIDPDDRKHACVFQSIIVQVDPCEQDSDWVVVTLRFGGDDTDNVHFRRYKLDDFNRFDGYREIDVELTN